MRTDIFLVGASGLARETAEAVAAGHSYRVAGVLDDDEATWGSRCGGHHVLGGIEVAAAHPRAGVVLCVGRGRVRHSIARRLQMLGTDDRRYATVIHPTASIGATSSVGAGSIILAGVVITADVTVGLHVVVMPGAVLTHDDVVADFATVCAGVTLAGGVTVGFEAYVGASSAVREGLTVGPAATIGMGAAVVRDVPAGETWVGTPARALRAASRPTSLRGEPS